MSRSCATAGPSSQPQIEAGRNHSGRGSQLGLYELNFESDGHIIAD
jgi:hypothetical protein